MPLTLRDLQAKLIRLTNDDGSSVIVPSVDQAQGVRFLCPVCFLRNGRKRPGAHSVICWSSSAGVPEITRPGPGRWRLVGTTLDDLRLMEEPGKSRSVLLLGGCAWHGFVTAGNIEILTDTPGYADLVI